NLTISNGGDVTAETAWIGGFDVNDVELDPNMVADFGAVNGVGTVTVTGEGSTLNVTGDDTLYVGPVGTGTLTISNGADVNSVDSYIGGYASFEDEGEIEIATIHEGGTGTATVTGAGSTWLNEILTLGAGGTGTLEISDGGVVNNNLGIIGLGPNSIGTGTVTGIGSTWTAWDANDPFDDDLDGTLIVGAWGEGHLTIADGGEVNAEDLYIGGAEPNELGTETDWNQESAIPDGTGTVTVTGEDSLLQITGSTSLYVGYSGVGTLDVNDGGIVLSDSTGIGVMPDSIGTATVDGDDSIWENTDNMFVGGYGTGTLTISDGGEVVVDETLFIGGFDTEDFDIEIGEWGDPNGTGTVTVTGEGSELINAPLGNDTILVGYSGDGTLNILNGGVVSTDAAIVGELEGSKGLVNVDGAGSTLLINGIGPHDFEGEGDGEVIISNGGQVIVNDPNALLVVGDNGDFGSGTLTVGATGTGSALTISNGGVVNAFQGVIGGYDPHYNTIAEYLAPITPLNTGTGSATVIGEGALWNLWHLEVGFSGDGTLSINDGGKVMDISAFIGAAPGVNGVVDVNDPGSLWFNLSDLVVGGWGNGTLNVHGGGQVFSSAAYLGGMPFDVIWTEADPNFIPTGTGRATVDGPGSLWAIDGGMCVGTYGNGLLTIRNGGQVASENMVLIGGSPFDELEIDPNNPSVDPNGIVTVTGDGSLLDAPSLVVGAGGTGTLNVQNGGGVNGTLGLIGFDLDSTGVATVDGNDSFWQLNDEDEANGTLGVGIGGNGHLTISNGGRVTTTDATVGGADVNGVDPQDYPTATVLVTGDNSSLQVLNNLHIGGVGPDNMGPGSVLVSDGGVVNVGNELYVWDTGLLGGDGTVNITAPTTLLNSGTISPGNSIGTLTVNGHVVFEPNSTFAVEISNDDTSDLLKVNGDVTINGGTVQAIAVDTIVGAHDYEIINADSVEGTFDVLNTAMVQSVANAGLGYDPNSVWLHISAMAFNDPNICYTDNQRNLGNALQFIATNQGGNTNTAALQGLANFNQVRSAFDELCGQTRPTLGPVTTSMTSNYIGVISGGLQRGSFGNSNSLGNGPLLAMAGSDPMTGMDVTTDVSPSGRTIALGNGTNILGDAPWGLWIKEYGLFGDRDSESGVFGYRYTTYGLGVGIDHYVTEELLLGITSGYSSGQIDYYNSRDKTDTDGIYLGLYGRWSPGSWYTQAMLTYAGMEYETDRYINFTGEHLKGDLDGYDIAGYIETGMNWENPSGWKINPLIAAQWSSLNLDSYSETGGPSALTFDTERFNSFKSALGARIFKDLSSEYDSRKLLWEVRGRWVHEFDDIQGSVDAAFVTNPGVLFKVNDSELSRDSAVLGTGIKTELFENTTLSLEYDVRLNADDVAHLVSIVFDHRW
ncbi:MAG: autotransporter domain-containing protein, partial [Sedimentisphaerales bacterium]|nr:autotransporter domain-containing protein [Sedimentisphaerales bacterium]